MRLSVVVPAFRAADTLARALDSLCRSRTPMPPEWELEILVVNDGSPDLDQVREIASHYREARVLVHEQNRGMCASRNTGMAASTGEIVTLLDADDEFDPDWPSTLAQILKEWPADVNVCYSACRNSAGQPTVGDPSFTGLISFQDLIAESHAGEYNPFFRGDYIRRRGYVDLKMGRSCGIVSYLTMAKDGPFWATPRVVRIYHDWRPGSVTGSWTDPRKAREMARCYEQLLERFGEQYREHCPKSYGARLLRHAVTMRLAGERGSFKQWARALHWGSAGESLGALLLLLLGARFCRWAVPLAKRMGLIKAYG